MSRSVSRSRMRSRGRAIGLVRIYLTVQPGTAMTVRGIAARRATAGPWSFLGAQFAQAPPAARLAEMIAAASVTRLVDGHLPLHISAHKRQCRPCEDIAPDLIELGRKRPPAGYRAISGT